MILLIRRKRLLAAAAAAAVLCSALLLPQIPAAAVGGGIRPTAAPVILDAGHGGADGGAVSSDGVAESGLNLAIVRKLEGVLRFCGYDTVLTRTGEDALCEEPSGTLRQQKVADTRNRVALVNGYPGARLISIHQNMLPGYPAVHGAQAFYNGEAGAEAMAQYVQQSLNEAVNDKDKDARRIDSSIYLMAHVTCPAVLVECGFLSNQEETALLQQPGHQLHIAAAIAAGFCQYYTNEGWT